MLFKIKENEGLGYSKFSGDKNKIHIDNLVGYNSIFGEKICHATFVISKILKTKEFRKILLHEKVFNISIEFLDFIKYNEYFLIKKIKSRFYIIQNKKIKIRILIQKKNNFTIDIKNKRINNYFEKKLINIKNRYDLIVKLLANISSYVGNIYPGKNSLLFSINLNFNDYCTEKKDKLIIRSYRLYKKFPLIKNILLGEKFKIEFETLERPVLKKNKLFIKKIIKYKIKDVKHNILVIGGSSGIGNDILNLFKINKKIIKIFTFNKNKINSKSQNTLHYKIDVFKDLKKINHIIQKYGPIKLFYFATTKILFDREVSCKNREVYKKIILTIPLKIIRKNKKKINSFFYPSTINIDEDKKSDYSKIKRLAEINLKKLCKKNKIIYKSVRFPALNSKQSISLLNPSPESFYNYLNKRPKIIDKIF